jgi:transposase
MPRCSVSQHALLVAMASRYELSPAPGSRIEDLLPGRKESVGRTAGDHRVFVNGVLWVLRSGARGSDLPERYGPYKSVPKRLARWATSGIWDRVLRVLTQDAKNEYLMIDSTLARAHQPAATDQKRGVRTRLWGVPEED